MAAPTLRVSLALDVKDFARLVSVATATPPDRYSQPELLALFGMDDRRVRGLFTTSHIRSRYLCLPPPLGPGKIPDESPEELNRKHLRKRAPT